MTHQTIIEKTLQAINRLPEDKAEEISAFADFVSKRYEDHKLIESIQKWLQIVRHSLFLKTKRIFIL